MQLSLIGPGDIEFHFYELLKMKKPVFNKHLNEIAKALAESNSELVILPDKGISFEIARLYKENGGKKVIASVPFSDSTFGIKHLEPYINQKSIIDETIDTENWYKHDLIKGLLGHAILYLGKSPGTNGELNYAIYLYKLITKQKPGVTPNIIHPNIIADKNFTIFVYQPFLKNKKLDKELEAYIKKFNIKLVYIKDAKQLEKELEKFKIKILSS